MFNLISIIEKNDSIELSNELNVQTFQCSFAIAHQIELSHLSLYERLTFFNNDRIYI